MCVCVCVGGGDAGLSLCLEYRQNMVNTTEAYFCHSNKNIRTVR